METNATEWNVRFIYFACRTKHTNHMIAELKITWYRKNIDPKSSTCSLNSDSLNSVTKIWMKLNHRLIPINTHFLRIVTQWMIIQNQSTSIFRFRWTLTADQLAHLSNYLQIFNRYSRNLENSLRKKLSFTILAMFWLQTNVQSNSYCATKTILLSTDEAAYCKLSSEHTDVSFCYVL